MTPGHRIEPVRLLCWARALLAVLLVQGCRPTAAPTVSSRCDAVGPPVAGTLSADARWCGTVSVEGNVLVPRGVTLRLDPGTIVRFHAYRGYRNPERRLVLRVEGRLVANGLPGRPIRFTSDAPDPRNGDWSMVKLVHARGSEITHAVFEFGQHGLNVWRTDLALSHLVLRYHNWEGLYVENHCTISLRHSRIYGNGYNCIAAEQFNNLTIEGNYIANCGSGGVLVDASRALVRGNLIEGSQEGLGLDNDAEVTALSNRFTRQLGVAVSCGEGHNRLRLGGNVFDGATPKLDIACDGARLEHVAGAEAAPDLRTGMMEGQWPALSYIPGDRRRDPYLYVYPDKDETRSVLRKIGGGLGLTWSLAWDGTDLWTASLEGEVFRIDRDTGKVLSRFRAPGPQPWGMAFDGQRLWINDFARRRIYGVDRASGRATAEIACPDPQGGCKGLAFDGRHLYALGWATHRLYQLSPTGDVISAVDSPYREVGGGVRLWVAGGLTWDGEAFWGPSDRLIRFDRRGRALGWIHSTSERVWDLAWDGETLWATQRANETWTEEPRIFQVKVLKLRTDGG
jgi:hypothetical protein